MASRQKQPRQFLKQFLKHLPAFQAIFRAVEAAGLAKYDFKEPILDLGCGDGLFSQIMLGKRKKIVGLDVDQYALKQAKKKNLYQKLVLVEADSIPFGNKTFKTVLANSSLEHVKEIEPVLKEIFRVLKKGGFLLLTAPSEKRKKYFSGRLHNLFFAHHQCWSGKKWQKKLKRIGFDKVDYQYLASNKTCFLSTIFFPFGLISWLEKKLFGQFLAWRKYTAPTLYFFLKNFPDQVKNENGAVVLVKAKK